MSAAPHFRTDPAAAYAFDTRAERDPASAVRVMQARGYRVDEGDVPVPYHEQLAELPPTMRGEFTAAHQLELANETRAVTLARNSTNILAQRANATAAQLAAARESAIAARTAQLEEADLAARRAAWRAQAEREIDGAPSPTTEQPRTKRTERNARA